MTTESVARRLVDLCREGKFDVAQNELFADRARSIEMEGTPNAEVVGMDAIPWDELAFPSVRFTLERFREDLASGHFALHSHVFDGR